MMQIEGFILAGGKSSRMGTDKATLLYKGKPMYQYALQVLKALCNNVCMVSSNPLHQQLPINVIPDKVENIGPLAGLFYRLDACKKQHCYGSAG
ncbi:MAG: NTP transferase domain-containing protein [Bacteroidales bacterium]|nr:NTP transferase domain-containing protein [Bacteroidales bacterium]